MLRYLLRRLCYMIAVLAILSVVLFGLYKLVPGDPALLLVDVNSAAANPQLFQLQYNEARETLGLDAPIYVQYCKWVGNLLTGDLGFSAQYRAPVAEVIAVPLRNTVVLNLACLVIVFSIAIPLGILTAVKKYTAFDTGVQVLTVVGVSLPSFMISLIFIYIFAIKLQWFPISGNATAGVTLSGFALLWDRLKYMALPLAVLCCSSLAGITRYVRGAMIEALSQDYIRTARAKGVREKVVIYSHAFRNALIPVVTIATTWFVTIFGGSVVIESVFLWNGIGRTLYNSLRQQDFAVVLAMQIFYVVLTLVGNLIMDLTYGLVDPRVKLSQGGAQ